MSLHYLDPDREPRECPDCIDGADMSAGYFGRCVECNGTGQLGVEGAEPDVKTEHVDLHRYFCGAGEPGWYWSTLPHARQWTVNGPFPTETAALEAARKARK